MKAEKYCFIWAVFAGILCLPMFGEVESHPLEDKPILLGQPNPALTEITGLNVTIVPARTEPNTDGLVWKELEKNIVHKLKHANIAAASLIDGKFSLFSRDVPHLRVHINILKLPDSHKYVFYIETTLARTVTLPGQRKLYFKTDVWNTEPIMQAVSVEDMPSAVTSAVLEQVEAFIHAYLAANSPNKQPAAVNDISRTAKKQLEPAAESTPTEYKYVASKNSKVFHKPECSSAKRIKPENLIGYSSRDEAINAGKRPCKRCNP